MKRRGIIRKGIGGFYYVETAEGICECAARGIFRKKKLTPYAGDRVEIETRDGADGAQGQQGVIQEILDRKNYLIRPPVANLDRLFVVVSMRVPRPNLLILDKTIAVAAMKGITPVVLITKGDLCGEEGEQTRLMEIYRQAGICCLSVSAFTGQGLSEIAGMLEGQLSAFTGNSGVGKSTLLNGLFPKLQIKTGEISDKLGRGRHTTREVELYPVGNSGYVADTPGFSTFDIEKYDVTEKEQLIFGFREFAPFYGACRFSSCTHTGEKGCAIVQEVKAGSIQASRYQSYLGMYQEIKDRKPWMGNKKNV